MRGGIFLGGFSFTLFGKLKFIFILMLIGYNQFCYPVRDTKSDCTCSNYIQGGPSMLLFFDGCCPIILAKFMVFSIMALAKWC